MAGAAHNRGRSKQDYATPPEFVEAVEELLGERFVIDLAADATNAKVRDFIPESVNSLTVDWREAIDSLGGGWGWLNPPFSNIRPWAQKCAEESGKGARVALLVPASVGSEWFAEHVDQVALVRPIRPRLSFDGKNGYPKDIMLCLYGLEPGFAPWRWKP